MSQLFDAEAISKDLHTIADFLRWAMSRFNEADVYFGHGTDNPWDEAVNLMLYTLHLPEQNDDNLMHCNLTKEEKSAFVQYVQQRIEKRVPAAYITNKANFAGLPFYVDERVLVPRSPIGELIRNKFSTLIPSSNVHRILDLCTGSGCIAVACAYAFPDSYVDAVDLSDDALEVAAINIDGHGLSDRVIPIKSNVFSGVEGEVYDLIVTNPPYVDEDDMASLPQEYLHEPQMGLASGVDGLDIVKQILAEADEFLSEQGMLVCEVGNSCVHLQQQYPQVPFNWIEFEFGGHGVFSLTREQLSQHKALFKK